ncbi:MAG: hypothetical protein QOI22_479 [Verrucomicrobiota bacterium]
MKTTWWCCVPILVFTGCATITRGVHEKFRVESEPSGARVELSSGERGVTPFVLVKTRKENFSVTVSKPGFISQTVKVQSNFSPTGGGAMAGNLIAGGVVGVGVDAMSGASLSLYPNPVRVRLLPGPASPALEKKSRGPTSVPEKERH